MLLLGAFLAWMLAGGSPPHRAEEDEDLLAAETEVRELDAAVGPDDADDELDDWGPGVPRRRGS